MSIWDELQPVRKFPAPLHDVPTVGETTFERPGDLGLSEARSKPSAGKPSILLGYSFGGNDDKAQRVQDLSDRCKLMELCGAIHRRRGLVCNAPLDHDDNHIVRELNAHGDPSGKIKATWGKLVLL